PTVYRSRLILRSARFRRGIQSSMTWSASRRRRTLAQLPRASPGLGHGGLKIFGASGRGGMGDLVKLVAEGLARIQEGVGLVVECVGVSDKGVSGCLRESCLAGFIKGNQVFIVLHAIADRCHVSIVVGPSCGYRTGGAVATGFAGRTTDIPPNMLA